MTSESARATSTAEARFRVPYPNSAPRAIKVIALDEPASRAIARISQGSWNRAAFFTSLPESTARGGDGWSMQGWLKDLAGRTMDLVAEIDSADLVVMVLGTDRNPQAASLIGEACQLKGVTTTALVLDAGSSSDEALSRILAHVRPYVSMLVVATGEEYIEAMLTALRA